MCGSYPSRFFNKHQISTHSPGNILDVDVQNANIHDSKGSRALATLIFEVWPIVKLASGRTRLTEWALPMPHDFQSTQGSREPQEHSSESS